MPLGIMVLLLGIVGYVVDLVEKEKKKQNRQQKTFPKPKKPSKHTELMHPVTKKALDTAFWGVFNSVLDTTPQLEKPMIKPHSGQQNLGHDMSSYEEDYEEEFYEDEENFETELTTPMSMAIDEEPLYSDSEWETIAREKSEIKVAKANQMTPRKKRGALQKAYIYSEVFGKPKGLE